MALAGARVRALIWLGGFLTGAFAMLALIWWVMGDTEGFTEKRFAWPSS